MASQRRRAKGGEFRLLPLHASSSSDSKAWIPREIEYHQIICDQLCYDPFGLFLSEIMFRFNYGDGISMTRSFFSQTLRRKTEDTGSQTGRGVRRGRGAMPGKQSGGAKGSNRSWGLGGITIIAVGNKRGESRGQIRGGRVGITIIAAGPRGGRG